MPLPSFSFIVFSHVSTWEFEQGSERQKRKRQRSVLEEVDIKKKEIKGRKTKKKNNGHVFVTNVTAKGDEDDVER